MSRGADDELFHIVAHRLLNYALRLAVGYARSIQTVSEDVIAKKTWSSTVADRTSKLTNTAVRDSLPHRSTPLPRYGNDLGGCARGGRNTITVD